VVLPYLRVPRPYLALVAGGRAWVGRGRAKQWSLGQTWDQARSESRLQELWHQQSLKSLSTAPFLWLVSQNVAEAVAKPACWRS
jgi:hypothetical protein